MKLLFDATELSYDNEKSGKRAGIFNVSKNIFEELRSIGVNITFTCDYRRYFFLKRLQQYSKIPLIKEHSIINKLWGISMLCFDRAPIRIKYALLILSRFYDRYLYRENKKNRTQLEGFDAYFSPYTPPNKEIENSSIKKYRMIHDVIPIVENGMPKSPKDWYYKIYISINENDFYFANSEYTKQDILKYFPCVKTEHIKATLLGANNNFYAKREKPLIEGKYIFSLCSLGKRKNLEFSINNFFKFIKKHEINDLKLVLGGSVWTKYQSELNKILDKYDKTKIILTGYIKDEDLRNYYSNALCFIFPSLYEGFGLPVLEAMQCGCPVITSNTTSLPEVIGDCGIKINPKDDEEMIQAFERMYYDNIFRALCSENGLERAKIFSWKNCASEIFDFIKSTL